MNKAVLEPQGSPNITITWSVTPRWSLTPLLLSSPVRLYLSIILSRLLQRPTSSTCHVNYRLQQLSQGCKMKMCLTSRVLVATTKLLKWWLVNFNQLWCSFLSSCNRVTGELSNFWVIILLGIGKLGGISKPEDMKLQKASLTGPSEEFFLKIGYHWKISVFASIDWWSSRILL